MSFTSDVLPLLGSIIAIIVILYLTYLASKYISKKVSLTSSGGSIKIHERMALAQDKFLAIASIDGKYYLLGVATNNISILKELPDYTPPAATNDVNMASIKDVFKKVGKSK